MQMIFVNSYLRDILLILIFLFYIIDASIANSYYLKKDHSLVKPYQGSWDFYGSTLVTANYVRLTSNRPSMQGAIWNNVPVSIRHWEAHVHFKVHGAEGALFGDGLAFWYVDSPLKPGPVFGVQDHFKGLGIFLDTYSNHNGPHNHEHPYISAMVNNGSSSYDHDRDGTHTQLSGCTSHFRNKEHDTLLAVRYSHNTLTVSTDIDNKGEWEECFTVRDVKLPTFYYFGLSALTGDLSDNHDIISMKVYELDMQDDDAGVDYRKIEPSAGFFSPPRDHVGDSSGGFMSGRLTGLKLLVIIVLACIGAAVCIVVGFLLYTNRSERNRFY